jgi:hypothetical protein
MHSTSHTKLTKTVTVAEYGELEAAGDRAACGRFIVERFHERYFEPTVDAPTRHGFTLMAIGCLVIEALECFYEGEADSDGKSKAMFGRFFERPTGLEVFGGGKNWFYKQIRCGILHQAETTGGWRILRSGPLLDEAQRVINARRFIDLLRAAVADHARQLEKTNDDDVLWKNFRKKMDAVCKNCERPAA